MSDYKEIFTMGGVMLVATIFVGLMTNLVVEAIVGIIIGVVLIQKGIK